MLKETPKFIARYYISRAIQLALIVLDQQTKTLFLHNFFF